MPHQYARGVYKEEMFAGIVEYRVYNHQRRLISRAELPSEYATPATDEAFGCWLDMLDPDGIPDTSEPSCAGTEPVPDDLAA